MDPARYTMFMTLPIQIGLGSPVQHFCEIVTPQFRCHFRIIDGGALEVWIKFVLELNVFQSSEYLSCTCHIYYFPLDL